MSDKKKPENNKDKNAAHYHPKFIPSKENLKKVEDAFEKSRKSSMKGKFEGWAEV